MATMRDIKRRKSSIESTEQITKAMKLVATVKLQKSRTKAENSETVLQSDVRRRSQEMLKKSTGIRPPLFKEQAIRRKRQLSSFLPIADLPADITPTSSVS